MSEFKIELIYNSSIMFSNAINAVKDKSCNQKLMAVFYADCIIATQGRQEFRHKWAELNSFISDRWPKGLERIKKMAWKIVKSYTGLLKLVLEKTPLKSS